MILALILSVALFSALALVPAIMEARNDHT